MLTNNQYDKLKWIITIVLPALATLINTIGRALDWQYTDITVLIITAITTFLGAIFMVSSNNYNGGDKNDL